MNQTLKQYIFFNSPLKERKNRIFLLIFLGIIFVLSLHGWGVVTAKVSAWDVLSLTVVSVLGSVIGYLILSFLDRGRHIRWTHFLVLLSVSLLFGPAAAYFNQLDPATRLFTVGFYEEGMKILPVVLLAIFLPNLIRTKKDGIILGAFAGMGFNIIELAAYIAQTPDTTPLLEAYHQHITRLGIWGLDGHVIWSAIAGLGVGYMVESKKKGLAKWKGFIICYVAVALAHSAFDLGAMLIGLVPVAVVSGLVRNIPLEELVKGYSTGLKNGMSPAILDGMRYMHFVYNAVFIVILVKQYRRSFAWESEMRKEELSLEKSDIVTDAEKLLINKEKFFFQRKYEVLNKKIGKQIVFFQNLLAIQKYSEKGQAHSPLVESIRAQIRALRE